MPKLPTPILAIKATLALALSAFSQGEFAVANTPSETGNPNFVLIFADDLGGKDVDYQSEGLFLTPNIERLARSYGVHGRLC